MVERSLRVYSQGTFTAILVQRAFDVGFYYLGVIFYLGYLIFAMFLLGAYAGRRGLFDYVSIHATFFRKIAWWGFTIGCAGNILYVITDLTHANARWVKILISILMTASVPTLALSYILAITLLFEKKTWRALFLPLANVGRMALTNYLLQSVICNLIFYSYGLGLYGRVSPMWGLLLSIVIFLIQIPLSGWWLGHFRCGPVEWL